MNLKCKNCDNTINKARESYFVKQKVEKDNIREINFCSKECIVDFEKKLKAIPH